MEKLLKQVCALCNRSAYNCTRGYVRGKGIVYVCAECQKVKA